MSAPVFVISPERLAAAGSGDLIDLDGPEGRHAVTVTRIAVGEPLELVDGMGRRAKAHVASIMGKDHLVAVVDRIADEPSSGPTFIVVQAIPKGDRGELAVELLTEIGADVIVPWSASRCIAHWRGDRAEKSQRKWSEAALAASKQSRRSHHLDVRARASTDDVVALAERADLALVLDEEAAAPIASITLPKSGEIVIVVGPEGGIAPEERHRLEGAGAHCVRLGPTVLRTSTAGVVALASLLPRTERWALNGPSVEG